MPTAGAGTVMVLRGSVQNRRQPDVSRPLPKRQRSDGALTLMTSLQLQSKIHGNGGRHAVEQQKGDRSVVRRSFGLRKSERKR